MDDITAIETITRNCYASFAHFPNAETIDDNSLFAVFSKVPIPFFSGVARTNIDASDLDARLESFRAKRCTFRWWVTPSTRPAGLAEMLRERGLRHAYDAPGMIADLTRVPLDAPLPDGVSIRRLAGADELDPLITVFAEVFARPAAECVTWRQAWERCGFGEDASWQHFVAFDGDTALATTSILTAGELAGVYNVGTLAGARGRGIGAAITRAAMRHARDIGATRAALQASESGFGVYRTLGFEQRCVVSAYEWVSEA